MDDRISSQALAGRASGILVGSPIALGWAAFGLSGLSPIARYPLLAIAIASTAILLMSGIAIRRRARSLPSADRSQMAAGKRAWLWFWLNFVGEIVLLNFAIYLLSAPRLHVYWVPAISAVVGLHFWPMAYFFRARSYWWVGAAMMGAAALAAFLIARDPASAFALTHGEAVANALILWTALGMGAVSTRRDSAPLPEVRPQG